MCFIRLRSEPVTEITMITIPVKKYVFADIEFLFLFFR